MLTQILKGHFKLKKLRDSHKSQSDLTQIFKVQENSLFGSFKRKFLVSSLILCSEMWVLIKFGFFFKNTKSVMFIMNKHLLLRTMDLICKIQQVYFTTVSFTA